MLAELVSWLGGEGLDSVDSGERFIFRRAAAFEVRSAGFAVVIVGAIAAGFVVD